jgi:hypothetical protein
VVEHEAMQSKAIAADMRKKNLFMSLYSANLAKNE